MSNTNDFLPFAEDVSANVESQADYLADASRPLGAQPGIASSKFNNKALRQANAIASQLAQIASDRLGSDVLDNGNLSSLYALLAESFSFVPPGSTLAYGGSSAPSGYLLAQGQAVSRTTYANLFTAIGTNFGSGDGSTTFNIPDLRWTFIRGTGPQTTITGTGTVTSNNVTFTGHGFNRSAVRVVTVGGALTGITTPAVLYTIYIDANTLAFASSRANALTGTKIAISGTNTLQIASYEDTTALQRDALAPGGNTTTSVGSHFTDISQNHVHGPGLGSSILETVTSGGSLANPSSGTTALSTFVTGVNSPQPVSALTNYTADTGNETAPQNVSMNYIIKT